MYTINVPFWKVPILFDLPSRARVCIERERESEYEGARYSHDDGGKHA